MKLLHTHYADSETRFETPLLYAIEMDNVETVQLLLECGADPNYPESGGQSNTPLHRCFSRRRGKNAVAIVKQLLYSPTIRINQVNADGNSALALVFLSIDYGDDYRDMVAEAAEAENPVADELVSLFMAQPEGYFDQRDNYNISVSKLISSFERNEEKVYKYLFKINAVMARILQNNGIANQVDLTAHKAFLKSINPDKAPARHKKEDSLVRAVASKSEQAVRHQLQNLKPDSRDPGFRQAIKDAVITEELDILRCLLDSCEIAAIDDIGQILLEMAIRLRLPNVEKVLEMRFGAYGGDASTKAQSRSVDFVMPPIDYSEEFIRWLDMTDLPDPGGGKRELIESHRFAAVLKHPDFGRVKPFTMTDLFCVLRTYYYEDDDFSEDGDINEDDDISWILTQLDEFRTLDTESERRNFLDWYCVNQPFPFLP